MCAQTIVKFARWPHRRQAHYVNKKAREAGKSFRIHHDLTKRQYNLLSRARAEINHRFGQQSNENEKIFAKMTNSIASWTKSREDDGATGSTSGTSRTGENGPNRPTTFTLVDLILSLAMAPDLATLIKSRNTVANEQWNCIM